jgi:hypothetical protein
MTDSPLHWRLGLGLVCLFLTYGCGAGDKRAAVSGKVTLDGQAVESGSITFQPIEGTQGPSAGTAVTKGVYQIPRAQGPLPGVYRVEIYSQRKTGNKIPAGSPAPPGTLVEEVVEAVPARFNAQSTLRSEVRSGNNPLDFNLSAR